MRLNVYAEEITGEVTLVKKDVTDGEFGTRTFYGLRFFLASPQELHHSSEDDDRSAITLWVPWTKRSGNRPQVLAKMLTKLLKLCEQVPTK